MGGSTRLKFPLLRRSSKKYPALEVQTISAPMTSKAQKLLGTGEINIDTPSPLSPSDQAKRSDDRSAVSGLSGISVALSESTAAASLHGKSGAQGKAKAVWDQESDIIPKGLGLSTSSAARSQALDLTTDASSLRRRGSGSTIVSYYDKTKLPLSISQQTSNSAMAKGLVGNRTGPPPMECPRPAPAPPTMHKRKTSRLDVASMLPDSASSRLSRLSKRGKQNMHMVLGSDLFTRSPSVVSTSSALSFADSEVKPGRLRRKLTKESLRSFSSARWSSFSSEPINAQEPRPLRERATESGNLNQLYEHYEQTSFRDAIDYDTVDYEELDRLGVALSSQPDDVGSRVGSKTASPNLARHNSARSTASTNKPMNVVSPSFDSVSWRPSPAYAPDEGCGPLTENSRVPVISPQYASPPGDYSASVSSRHTRTSLASKTTESFTDFDPNATSILNLSSDSEDDEVARTAVSNPSIRSRDSTMSPIEIRRRPSNASSVSGDPVRGQVKSRFRSSLNSQTPFLAIPEDEGATGLPSHLVNVCSSSTSSAITADSPRPSISTVASSVRSQSRLSQVSMSSTESVSTHFSRPRPSAAVSSPKQTSQKQAPETRHIAMQSRAVTPTPTRHETVPEQHQGGRPNRPSCSAKKEQPKPPMTPSSMDLLIRGPHKSPDEHRGPVLTISEADTAGEEQFIAVTPQEAMLLNAMRAKRALMRENSQKRRAKAGGKGTARSKKDTVLSIRTTELEPRPLFSTTSQARNDKQNFGTALQFPEPHNSEKASTQAVPQSMQVWPEEEDILMCLDRSISTMGPNDTAEPSPDLGDFIIDFDAQQFPTPPKASHRRTSSATTAASRLTHSKMAAHKRQHSSGRPRPDSEFLPSQPASFEAAPALSSHKVVQHDATTGNVKQSPERTTTLASATVPEQDSSQPSSRKRAVRISAVGLPEIGQWGDDG